MATTYKTVKATRTRVTCDSCDVLVINGHVCHEQGCPDRWRHTNRACKWCGQGFKPEERWQECCSESCAESYRS